MDEDIVTPDDWDEAADGIIHLPPDAIVYDGWEMVPWITGAEEE